MPRKASYEEVPLDKLRWKLDPSTLPFESTDDLEPLAEIVGQKRAVEAFKFGMGIDSQGYNVFVTGMAGSGRMSTVRKMLEEISRKERVPDDLCYINNFKNAEIPILVRLKGGEGAAFQERYS
jgi:Cdc6-like AAA superfamily ATPase